MFSFRLSVIHSKAFSVGAYVLKKTTITIAKVANYLMIEIDLIKKLKVIDKTSLKVVWFFVKGEQQQKPTYCFRHWKWLFKSINKVICWDAKDRWKVDGEIVIEATSEIDIVFNLFESILSIDKDDSLPIWFILWSSLSLSFANQNRWLKIRFITIDCNHQFRTSSTSDCWSIANNSISIKEKRNNDSDLFNIFNLHKQQIKSRTNKKLINEQLLCFGLFWHEPHMSDHYKTIFDRVGFSLFCNLNLNELPESFLIHAHENETQRR